MNKNGGKEGWDEENVRKKKVGMRNTEEKKVGMKKTFKKRRLG